MEYVIIDMPSSQPQHSSDSMQDNNGDNRSLASTGVGAQEKFALITALLEMGASRLGVLVCGWAVLVLVQGGIFVTVETKDRVSVTVLFFLVCFRCWRYFYPKDTGSLTEATQSLLADDIQQLALPIGFISRLFYWWNLVSVMTCVVLSMKRLASQDFGQTEVENKGARKFTLNVFYGLALAEALVLLFAHTFVTVMAMLRKVTEALIEWAKFQLYALVLLFALTFVTIMAMLRKVTEALIEWAKFQLYANSVGNSHLPESELDGLIVCEAWPHDSVNELKWSLESLRMIYVKPGERDLCSEINLSTLKHLYFNLECVPCLDLFPIINCSNLETLTLSWIANYNAKFGKKENKLIHPALECVPHQVLDNLISLAVFLRKTKYIHPRVSQSQQLRHLKVDYLDDSEDNLPHLKAD